MIGQGNDLTNIRVFQKSISSYNLEKTVTKTILPLNYDYTKLKQTPDVHQPEYTLKKYFKGVDMKNIEKAEH